MAYVIKLKVRYSNDNTGRELSLPGLFTESGILLSHLRYLAENSKKSQSWLERNTLAVKLLIQYINANQSFFTKTQDLLLAFTKALEIGTVNLTSGKDPSGLYWGPRKLTDTNLLLAYINGYTDYLASQDGYNNNRANPFRRANTAEQRLNWCAYYQKHSKVFLNHLSDINKGQQTSSFVRVVKAPTADKVEQEYFVRFPEAEINNLMDYGFVRPFTNTNTEPHCRYDFKNQAITLLMQYGGLRKSECFQLYLGDIVADIQRQEAVVRVFHPSNGTSPDPSFKTRREYLQAQFGLKPRMEYLKSERQHCGWKSPLLTDPRGFFEVFFAPTEKASEFLLVWANYLKHQRVDPPDNFMHPYAFTNSKGHPETIKNFQRLHADAVRRIGLQPEKYLGTTEHGHRHSYGYRLAEHDFSQREIQKAMHHKNPDSCLVYIQPTNKELRNKMKRIK